MNWRKFLLFALLEFWLGVAMGLINIYVFEFRYWVIQMFVLIAFIIGSIRMD